MALIEMGGRRFTIPVGELYLGSDASCAITVSGPGVQPRHARLDGFADGQVAIRKMTPAADVLINGVRLGAEPTPLLHGDKIEIGGQELTFVDERRSGSTQYVQALNIEQAAALVRAETGAPTGNTGGRLVCLTDGREYLVAGASLVFGREAGCDVVVPGKDVSRRHAEILQTPKGYLLVDSSTNGTFVNEERVVGQRLLARADVIRIGDEQFRFYADPAATAAEPPAAPAPARAGEQLKNTMHGLPATPPAGGGKEGSGAPLARLMVREGRLQGQRLAVRAPVVNLGRADYNDVVLPDPSVSTAHAKLQRREGVWVLADLESTNGSFVDGARVHVEAPVAPGATIRLGDVVLVFEPADDEPAVAKGGGTQVLRPIPPAAPAPAPPGPPGPPGPPAPPTPAAPAASPAPARPPARAKPRAPRPAPPPAKAKGCGSSAGVLLLAAVGLAYWILP